METEKQDKQLDIRKIDEGQEGAKKSPLTYEDDILNENVEIKN